MSKQINTHLFFHMNSGDSNRQKDSGQSSSIQSNQLSSSRKKPPSSLISGYEIDTNPPLPSESGDYYDYYTNYGIPEYYGQPISPSIRSPPYAHYNQDYPENNQQQQPASSYFGYDRNDYDYYNDDAYPQQQYDQSNYNDADNYQFNYSTQVNNNCNNNNLQAPLISPPIIDTTIKQTSPNINPGHWSSHPLASSYRNNNDHHQRGLSTFAHKLHRITFVEACIFQPPDLPSPVRAIGRSASTKPQQPLFPPPQPQQNQQQQQQQQLPILLQQQQLQTGERSPTSTGGTQYYQEWTSKHMRHLCLRFEKPDQQQLLMNVERKSKYPFIILCTPEPTSMFYSTSKSSSSSCSSSTATTTTTTKPNRYHRELSHHSTNSAYDNQIDDNDDINTELDEFDDDNLLLDSDNNNDQRSLTTDDHEHWLTQKQRDSVNSHYLPPPPPPLPMPHIWPEIRYIDGLYTVCASIVRPGSGVPCEYDEYLYSDINNQQSSASGKHISFQDTKHLQHQQPHHQINAPPFDQKLNRPTGYIVSAFATFPGEDSDRLEKNWLFWTGARILYKYLPNCVGLRRLIFLKRCPDMYRDDLMMNNHQNNQNSNNQHQQHQSSSASKIKPTIFTGFTYVLLCECFNLKESYIASVCTTIDQLRARCCGYSALYLTHFQQQFQPLQQSMQHKPQLHHQYSTNRAQYHHYQQQQPMQPIQSQSQPQFHPSYHPLSHHHHHHHHRIPRHHCSTSDFNDYDDGD